MTTPPPETATAQQTVAGTMVIGIVTKFLDLSLFIKVRVCLLCALFIMILCLFIHGNPAVAKDVTWSESSKPTSIFYFVAGGNRIDLDHNDANHQRLIRAYLFGDYISKIGLLISGKSVLEPSPKGNLYGGISYEVQIHESNTGVDANCSEMSFSNKNKKNSISFYIQTEKDLFLCITKLIERASGIDFGKLNSDAVPFISKDVVNGAADKFLPIARRFIENKNYDTVGLFGFGKEGVYKPAPIFINPETGNKVSIKYKIIGEKSEIIKPLIAAKAAYESIVMRTEISEAESIDSANYLIGEIFSNKDFNEFKEILIKSENKYSLKITDNEIFMNIRRGSINENVAIFIKEDGPGGRYLIHNAYVARKDPSLLSFNSNISGENLYGVPMYFDLEHRIDNKDFSLFREKLVMERGGAGMVVSGFIEVPLMLVKIYIYSLSAR